MARARRLSARVLIAVAAVLCAGAVALERAELFPLWQFAVRWSPGALPAARAAPPDDVASGRPIAALALADEDLYGPEGILEHKLEHGREWEREGSFAYFEGGRLLFSSSVGVRVHGGGSRITSPRQGFRLYFRRTYGPREMAPGLLFGPSAQPIRRLVIHNDVRRDADGTRWHFVNPLAYDIASAMGAIAPETKPVRFYLNGEYYGPFVLTERFDERYFAAHWGHDDVLLSQEAMDELWQWVQRTRPLTMAQVSAHVDLENLTRWFLSTAFCATRDAFQGPGQFLDQTRAAGWFWVNWDMDQGLRDWDHDTYQYLLERIAEPRRGRNRAESRAVLLTHLLAQDSGYREYFKRIFLQVMNHRITNAFLDERYRHYAAVAGTLEVEHVEYLPRLREFLEWRPAFFRLITEQWLNTAPSQTVTLVAPDGVVLVIDGERVSSGYEGLYFPDLEMSVDVDDPRRAGLIGWRINDRVVRGARPLTFLADRPLRIEALFREPVPGEEVVQGEEPGLAGPAPEAVEPVWRQIPAGSFWMGCVPGDRACGPREEPRVQVTFDEPFAMTAHEVTAGAFRAYAAATRRPMPRQPEWYADARHPVVNVTWDEAQEYCQWLGGRLPTEEEWEYAARGGRDGELYPWGNEAPGGESPRGARVWTRTTPVGLLPPNGFGLHDTAGNVWEWTVSRFRATHATPPPGDPYDLRTIRGGSWDSGPGRLRTSERVGLARHGRHNLYVGFRCMKMAELR